MNMQCNGKSIVSAIKLNDRQKHTEAFNCLYQKVYPNIKNTVRDYDSSNDLFQYLSVEIWIKVRAEKIMYKGENKFFALCNLIWKRRWWEMKGRMDRVEEISKKINELIEGENSEPVWNEDHYTALKKCWPALSEECRKILGFWMNGYSYVEIKIELDENGIEMSLEALRMKKLRCMKQLRKCTRGKFNELS